MPTLDSTRNGAYIIDNWLRNKGQGVKHRPALTVPGLTGPGWGSRAHEGANRTIVETIPGLIVEIWMAGLVYPATTQNAQPPFVTAADQDNHAVVILPYVSLVGVVYLPYAREGMRFHFYCEDSVPNAWSVGSTFLTNFPCTLEVVGTADGVYKIIENHP